MRVLYIDLLSGAAGDMLLAGLVDCGFPLELLKAKLDNLPIEPVPIRVEKTVRNGITGTRVIPECPHSHEHRHLEDILTILRQGTIDDNVYNRCEKVLDRLALAEAEVHGIPKEKVHFHEIGALDTIVDILGFCMALEYFKVDTVLFSTLTDGYGTVTVAHGVMPVPVPATAVMIKGLEVQTVPVATELLTPTGAALLTTLGKQQPGGGAGTVIGTGYGCGSKVLENHPNFLRCTLYETSDDSIALSDKVVQCETDMDHITGEIMGDVGTRLLEAGAFDVCWIPVFMKKGRPGYRLSVLVAEEMVPAMVDLIIRQTRTLGVRIQKTGRIIAQRSVSRSSLAGHECTEKHCTYKGYSFSKPEYESLAAISRKTGQSVLDLMEAYVQSRP